MKQTALITGASRGIGAAIARRLAANGYRLALCCRQNEARLDALGEECSREYGTETLRFVGDVGDYAFMEQMLTDTLREFGQLDVLVNNAGMDYIGLLTDMSIEDWNRIVATNLTSVFSACKLAIPAMVSRKRGTIINISSVWGSAGASCEAAYSACKGGINALTRALGKELAPSGIRVNAIACGLIDTDMNRCFTEAERRDLIDRIPAGRMGTPDEVAELVYALCTAPGYLTGQVITLDGGWL